MIAVGLVSWVYGWSYGEQVVKSALLKRALGDAANDCAYWMELYGRIYTVCGNLMFLAFVDLWFDELITMANPKNFFLATFDTNKTIAYGCGVLTCCSRALILVLSSPDSCLGFNRYVHLLGVESFLMFLTIMFSKLSHD